MAQGSKKTGAKKMPKRNKKVPAASIKKTKKQALKKTGGKKNQKKTFAKNLQAMVTTRIEQELKQKASSEGKSFKVVDKAGSSTSKKGKGRPKRSK